MQFSKLLSGFGRIISSGLCVFGFLQAASSAKAAVQLDPNLNVGIWRTNQGFVLNWFASNTVSYQVESSSNLVVWSNASAVVTGSSSTVYVTNTATPGNAFFRVRRLPLLTAAFDVTLGILRIYGDDQDNVITVSRNAGGALLVNNGAVQISGGIPTIANTVLIEIYGRPGGDQLSLNEDNGALPRANIFGEDGDDVLTGGSGADQIFGGPGQDSLAGRGGADMLYGGTGNDTLTGGDADDQVFGEGDNDRLVWNPGDDTDLNEGGIGTDTVEVNGGGGAEQFTTTANGTRVRFDRLDPAPFSLDIGTCEQLVLNANGGDDSFSATGNLAALIQITVDGGTGADTILGSNGIDILMGSDNDDFIDGQQGNDVVFLGGGNDTFQWDPGDGSDVVEGQSGSDTVLFNGSGGNENFVASANGLRVLFTRDLGNIVMDLDDVENFNLRALGGTDTVSVNPMNGTDLITFNVSLALTIGGATGDAVADTVIVNGSSGDDIITATSPGGDVLISGLFASVSVDVFEALDTVRIQGLAGNDILDASGVGAVVSTFVFDGGAGNDIVLGSAGADTILGGDNDDVLLGAGGLDALDGGAGANISLQDGGPNVSTGVLTVFGDDAANAITVSRDAGGLIYTNGVAATGFTVANTTLIRVFGKDGNDTITLNQANGALPMAALYGGPGTNVLTGGSGADFLFGGLHGDALQGVGGADHLFGGAGNDTLTGGDADDQVFGEGDNDRLVWNPGDDTDLNEGGIGTDTVEVNGGGGAEQFTTTANGTRVRFDRLDPAPFSLDIGTCEQLVLNANGGDDSFSATGNLAALIQITVDGGTGADTILGSNGIDILMGGDNDDFIDGQQGNDVVFLGGGNDTFQWDPGDGSDVVEGQSGSDTVLFNGSAGNENFVASANGLRVLFTRDLGNIVMDLNDVENFNLRALGGTDTVSVNPMNGTDLITFNVSLALTIGGATGDAVADTVIVNGSSGADLIDVFGAGTSASVVGLFAQVNITTAEGTNDVLIVNALSGDDSVTATTVPAGVIKLTLDGGAHNDTLLGSQDADVLLGGDGDDFLHGDGGNDVAFMGANNDVFRWDPGDGNDTIEGQAGVDTLTFYGSAVAENISVTPNGGRVLFFRDIASVTLDMDDVETVNYRALAGADNAVVGDLSGTDLASISVDLSGPGGGGDLAADTVTVNGSQVADNMAASGNVTGVSITGLHTAVNILSQESVNDRLTLNGLGGDDVVDASALGADGIQLSINGGLGADILLGSQGGDLINGGDGNDLAFMGPGGDAFVWNPGDDLDTIEGQAGVDTLIFNGANVAESINISANGSRVLFFRDIASVTLDLNSVETLDCNVLGGADNVVCNSLAGTDLTTINMNLAASGGAGDAALDLVTINGTASPDVITLTTNSGAVEVSGLATLVRITAPEVANDDLVVNGLGGTDTFTIGPGVTTLIGVSVNQ